MSADHFFLGVDIETSGPNHHTHALLAIGAAVVNADTFQTVDTFRVLFPLPKEQDRSWDERTYREFWSCARKENNGNTPLSLLQSLQQQYGVSQPRDGLQQFWTWLTSVSRDKDVVICTDTSGYDIGWLESRLGYFGIADSMLTCTGKYKPIRNVSNYADGVMGRNYFTNEDTSRDTLVKLGASQYMLNVYDLLVHDHDPVNDAITIATEGALYHALATTPELQH